MSGAPPPITPEQVERLKGPEQELIRKRENVPWVHPHVERRMGDPLTTSGFMLRYQCRFCIELDGQAPTLDLGRIGFTTQTQFIEHIRDFHERR